MTHSPARYLLRIDDLCPTVCARRWQLFQSLIAEFHLQPILAAVPDNRDPELEVSQPDPECWRRLRALEAAGATIGLHGFRHLCRSRGRSLVDLQRASEFAGVAAETQRAWIGEGLRILRGHGLSPRIWVAPRHGFDRHTLAALQAEGITLLSDGLTRAPLLGSGMVWIPQQRWGPEEKSRGLWTICVHPNTTCDAEFAALRSFIAAHAAQFTSVERALVQFPPAAWTLAERIHAVSALGRRKISRAVGRVRRALALRSSSSV